MFSKHKFNVLITGSRGQLGSYLVKEFQENAFYKNSPFNIVQGIDIDTLDISNPSAIEKFFNTNIHIDIDYVIHCAAATDTWEIEQNPTKFYAINVLGPKLIAEYCAKRNIKLIFISSDYVLSEYSTYVGNKLQEFPVNQYGLQKLLAEQFIKQAYSNNPRNYTILRSSWMYGNSNNSFVEKFLTNVFTEYFKNESCDRIEIQAVGDAWGRPTPVWLISNVIESWLRSNSKCMYGTVTIQDSYPQISRFDWAKLILSEFIYRAYRSLDLFNLNLIKEFKFKFKLIPVKSNEFKFGNQIHHPGKIQENLNTFCDNTVKYNPYLNDMQDYMEMKAKYHSKLLKEIQAKF